MDFVQSRRQQKGKRCSSGSLTEKDVRTKLITELWVDTCCRSVARPISGSITLTIQRSDPRDPRAACLDVHNMLGTKGVSEDLQDWNGVVSLE